jgi:hypothetical protein
VSQQQQQNYRAGFVDGDDGDNGHESDEDEYASDEGANLPAKASWRSPHDDEDVDVAAMLCCINSACCAVLVAVCVLVSSNLFK